MNRQRMFIFMFAALALAIGCGTEYPSEDPWTLSELEIEVADTSREVSYSNTVAGFYYTESNRPHRSSWQGWHVSSVKILSDYVLDLDGRLLDRSTSDYARIWPHEFTRSYHEGVQETFMLLDNVNAFTIRLENVRSASVGLSLVFDMSAQFDNAAVMREGAIVFSPFPDRMREQRPDVPGWIGIAPFTSEANPQDSLVRADGKIVRGRVSQGVTDGRAAFIIAAASSPDSVLALIRNLRQNSDAARQQRIDRMEDILNHSFIRTSETRFDKALAWAKISLDALVMDQERKGIFAGLPWFSNYWGRDTFISLPGATLVTGRYSDAKEILLSFAAWQDTDMRSPNAGRIPNIATPTSIAFNTTDGTPWFILALHDYVLSSGDTAFAREFYPVIQRAADGPLRHRTDRYGFLLHDDAETWMDAVGPDGPWSPRGNRANDIQALWQRQLLVSSSIAGLLGHHDDAERWGLAAEDVLFAFRDFFVDSGDSLIYDHLNSDGSPDASLRPNQLFALDLIGDNDLRAGIFRRLTEDLVYEHGVGSLSPNDENFHPFHHIEPLYVQDAAYHNGIVWTWQNGPWIEQAVHFGKTDLAYRVSDNMVHQILDRGAVGTISELLDAAPRQGESEPRLSGTFSQAWSLAEFLRTTYRSYLGLEVDAINHQVWLRPHLPEAIRSASFTTFVGPTELRISYQSSPGSANIRLSTSQDAGQLSVSTSWPFAEGVVRTVNVQIRGGQQIDLVITPNGISAEADDGSTIMTDTQVQTTVRYEALEGMTLATPLVRPDLRSLAGPDYERIPHSVISSAAIKSGKAIVNADDPKGDDTGTGSYTYPSTTNLRSGSLDLLNYTMFIADSMVTFELTFAALSDPGWHPEYGFQLTYVAIAIDTNGVPGSGQARVGRNAAFPLPRGWEYETIVYVGGGIQIEDDAGNICGAYVPAPGDASHPLGDAMKGVIRFSLPTRILGVPSDNWRYTVLIGAQDDHGGAGIGEFRTVDAEGGEWQGGGKKREQDPNVYDVLRIP